MMPLLTPTHTSTVLGEPLDQSEQNCTSPYNTLFSRAGSADTEGLVITFVSSEGDQQVMDAIQAKFEVVMTELPDGIDLSSYSESHSYAPAFPKPPTSYPVTS